MRKVFACLDTFIANGAELGGATGAMAPLVFWSRSIKKSRKVSKSKSRSLEWHQLFLPLFGANGHHAPRVFIGRLMDKNHVIKKHSTIFCHFFGALLINILVVVMH